MQEVKKFNVANGVSLNFIDDKKYKTVSVSVYLSRRLDRAEVTKNSLLSSVLAQGTKNLPTAKDIDRYLKSLYGAAYSVSKKNLVKIPVINGTIPHKQESRYSGSLVMIRPAAPGTGVIAGGAMRAVLESVGVKNVLAKSKGSSNPHNLVKATIAALCELRDAHSVAQLRGISMNQVFNG